MTEILGNTKLKNRDFKPDLSVMKVTMMEIIGEFLSYDCDQSIWAYFKTHWSPWFSKLISRSNFAQ